MTPSRSRFVTACQQLLALAVVLAVLTPAASLVTLDVVGSAPVGPDGTTVLSHPDGAHGGVHRRGRPRLEGAHRTGDAGRPRGPAHLGRPTVGRTAAATSAARVVAAARRCQPAHDDAPARHRLR